MMELCLIAAQFILVLIIVWVFDRRFASVEKKINQLATKIALLDNNIDVISNVPILSINKKFIWLPEHTIYRSFHDNSIHISTGSWFLLEGINYIEYNSSNCTFNISAEDGFSLKNKLS